MNRLAESKEIERYYITSDEYGNPMHFKDTFFVVNKENFNLTRDVINDWSPSFGLIVLRDYYVFVHKEDAKQYSENKGETALEF